MNFSLRKIRVFYKNILKKISPIGFYCKECGASITDLHELDDWKEASIDDKKNICYCCFLRKMTKKTITPVWFLIPPRSYKSDN